MPVGAVILGTALKGVSSLVGSKVASAKGLGIGVRAINKVKNFASNVLGNKTSKAEIRLQKSQLQLAQLKALEGGVAGSSQKKESAFTSLAFGNTFNPESKEVKKELQNYKDSGKSIFKNVSMESEKGQKMEKAKEFLSKYWMYAVGGLVLFMVFKKKRR